MATTSETTPTKYSGPGFVSFKPHGLGYFPGVSPVDTSVSGVNRGCHQTIDPEREITSSSRILVEPPGSPTDNILICWRKIFLREAHFTDCLEKYNRTVTNRATSAHVTWKLQKVTNFTDGISSMRCMT